MLSGNGPQEDAVAVSEARSDRDRRRALGIYYTPPDAAQMLARWAIRRPMEAVLEPSFGGCAMLAAAVDAFKLLGNPNPSRQLYGYDVDSAAFAHLAQMSISNSDGNFKKQDFLQSSAGDLRVDAVLANPPFVSYHRLNSEQRMQAENLRRLYLPSLPKLASIWVHFILHAMSFLREDGRMAFVLPTAVGTADYAKPLLEFLQTKFLSVELVHVSERIFIQAGADERISLLLLNHYRPEGGISLPQVYTRYISKIREIDLSGDTISGTTELPKKLDVRDNASSLLSGLVGRALQHLGSVATVRIGEVVGNINYFVRPLSEWRDLGVEEKYLKPLLTRSAQVHGIYVRNGKSEDEILRIPHLLIPPEAFLPEAIKIYLSKYPESAIIENQTFKKRSTWYTCSYGADADAFIGSMSHEYPRIIGNDAGISCSNAFYKIKGQADINLNKWLPMLSLSTPFHISAELLGRVRGSGGIKLEPSDVKKTCIPIEIPHLSEVVFRNFQKAINNLLLDGKIEEASQEIDKIVFIDSKLIESSEMLLLREMRIALTNHRLNREK